VISIGASTTPCALSKDRVCARPRSGGDRRLPSPRPAGNNGAMRVRRHSRTFGPVGH
jgi:hypothetical protein